MNHSEKIVIVSGMHRSGTSMVSMYLNNLGIELGDELLEGDRNNPRGYYEDMAFVDLQSKILEEATKKGKKGWPNWGYTEDDVFDRSRLEKYKEEARKLITKKKVEGKVWGWKDPRSTLLLDFWKELEPGAKHLIIYRNPWEVMRSVQKLKHENFINNPHYALKIWKWYNKHALKFYKENSENCLLVSANRFLQRPDELAGLLKKKLNVEIDPVQTKDFSFFTSRLFYSQDVSEELKESKDDQETVDLLKELHCYADMPGEKILEPVVTPKVSIVIPCYNMGEFIKETVYSVKRSLNDSLYEMIIVDDGSTDENTLKVLDELEPLVDKVIHQKNKGLSGARNTGVKEAKADYILPLDADNKIEPSYFIQAIEVLDTNKKIGVVYSNARIFGEKSGFRNVPEYDFTALLGGNYIDACAVIRKKCLEECGGYDETMKVGYEDWDVWLQIGGKGWGFYHLHDYLFDYRVRNGSMVAKCNEPAVKRELVTFMLKKHDKHFSKHWKDIYINQKVHEAYLDLEINHVENTGKHDVNVKEQRIVELQSEIKEMQRMVYEKIDYYENSAFWKLKKVWDKTGGKILKIVRDRY